MTSLNENSVNKQRWDFGKQHEYNTVMEINNYESWASSNSVIKGSPFDFGGRKFCIDARSEQTFHNTTLRMGLELLSNEKVDLEWEVSIINSNGTKIHTQKERRNLNKKRDKAHMAIVDESNSKFSHFNQLLLHCKIAIFGITMFGEQGNRFIVPHSSLADNLNDLLESGESTDVILRCEGEQFKAHKSILAARSPVFAAMFRHDLKEQKHALVDIVDMDKDVLKEMLKYMYTDKTGDLGKIANGLLAAADKYALERLRIMCEQSLAARLTIENAADTLIFADAHSADQLKEQTIEFIKGHKDQVIKTAAWKRAIKERVHLILKTFELIEN